MEPIQALHSSHSSGWLAADLVFKVSSTLPLEGGYGRGGSRPGQLVGGGGGFRWCAGVLQGIFTPEALGEKYENQGKGKLKGLNIMIIKICNFMESC